MQKMQASILLHLFCLGTFFLWFEDDTSVLTLYHKHKSTPCPIMMKWNGIKFKTKSFWFIPNFRRNCQILLLQLHVDAYRREENKICNQRKTKVPFLLVCGLPGCEQTLKNCHLVIHISWQSTQLQEVLWGHSVYLLKPM